MITTPNGAPNALLYRPGIRGSVNVYPENGKTFQLAELQKLVGGYIELVPISPTIFLAMNEDGKALGLERTGGEADRFLQLAGGSPSDYLVGSVLVIPAEALEQ